MDRVERLYLYQEFIKRCTTSSGSYQNYSQFSRIDKIIKALHPEYSNLIEYDSSSFVEGLQNELLDLDELPTEPGMTFKKLGNGQYNNAISTYIKFLKAVELLINTPIASRGQNRNLNSSLQQIYYGAPGTGKSHSINEQTEGESVIRTTFHPDSDYSTFVGAYKPTTKQITLRDMSGHPILEDGVVLKEDRIVYEFVDQAFLQAYVKAWKFYAENEADPKKQFLVIEEINRGNCAQIFGDLFQLLDRNEWGFSDYPINADKDMKKQLKKAFTGLEIKDKQSINGLYKGRDVVKEVLEGDILLLPSNLYIWATMNTSDQSLFPIDSAFKRRWDWKYIPIKDMKLNYKIRVKNNNGTQYDYDWGEFLAKVNEAINATTNSEDKKLGYFFCKAQKNKTISVDRFVSKVLFYLFGDVLRDYDSEEISFKYYNETFSLLKWKEGDKQGNFRFSDFFDISGNGKDSEVARFLDNIKVNKVLVEENIDDETEGNDKVGMTIIYNGEEIREKNNLETYVKAIEKIGVERIAPLNITCYGQQVVGTEPPANYAWRTVNDYKILTFKLHRHMERILNEIAAGLQEDIKVTFE